MEERVGRTAELPLTAQDLRNLKDKRNRQIILIAPAFIALLLICIYLWISGPGAVNNRRYHDLIDDEEKIAQYERVLPYVLLFAVLMISIYFTRIFFQAIYPLMKDIRSNTKKLYYYCPAKTCMPYFNKFYISTPIFKKQQVEITRPDFESLEDNQELCVEVAPASCMILRVTHDDRSIDYH